MRNAYRCAALLAALLLALPAAADKAKSLYDQARDAEARQNYEQAFELYRQVHELKPKDTRYRTGYERTKFLAAASHVHRGQLLREGGKLTEALIEFQRGAEVDPASFIAAQEIRRTQDMINAANAPAPAAAPPDAIERQLEDAQGPPELAPIAPVPITLNMSEDAKVVFQTIGQLAAVNVLFDPDYTSRRISVKLNNVTLEDALGIVALESRSFWRPVTTNTIFVTNDTPTKRNELEQQVLKTFYLSNVSEPTDIQDIVNTLRTILNLQRVQALPTRAAVVVRGTPDQIALSQKLIDDIDKARPEVVIDVAVMQVRRDKLRELGIKPPTSATIQLQGNVSTSTGTGTGTTGTTSPTNTINLNKFPNLKATDFLVTIPGATATFLLTDSNTKIIQNPQIRASNNVKASLKIGDRIPVATGSFQPGIGGVGINPLVNTQFQYIDVGVNIDITPRVHANREVSMKLTLEISSVTSHVSIGGIDQPVIGQRKIDHEIRLKEGEVNLLGGILEEQDVKSLTGLPGLGQIPFFKYLFSDTQVQRQENEIIFLLVPHIVRAQDLTDLNQRALDVGTGNTIEMRRGRVVPASAPGGGAQPAPVPTAPQSSPVPPMQAPGANPSPLAATPPAEAAPAVVGFEPTAVNAVTGATFAVNVTVKNARDLATIPVQVTFDKNRLQLLNVSNGTFLSRDGQVVVLTHREDPDGGTVQMTASRPPGAPGISGDGPVFTLTFLARQAGASSLVINRSAGRTPANQAVPLAGSQATVNIR